MVGLQRSVPVLRAAPALGWNTPHYRDTPPKTITIGRPASASESDASEHASIWSTDIKYLS